MPNAALVKRAKKIKLIAMDVDGVLTDGGVIVLQSGEEVKVWNAKDRLGLALMRDKKVPLVFAWITGRSSQAVLDAAEDLGVHHVVQKCTDKKAALGKILSSHYFQWDEAAYIGDDLIDFAVMKAVGLSACPADAVPDIRAMSNYISPLNGGRGVVRDVMEFVLKAQGKWKGLVSSLLD